MDECLPPPSLPSSLPPPLYCRLEEAYGEARNEQKFIKAEAERIATVLVCDVDWVIA